LEFTVMQTGHEHARTFHRHYKQLINPKDALRYWNIYPQKGWKLSPPPAQLRNAERQKLLKQADRSTPANFTIVVPDPQGDHGRAVA
jgi:hypothetical protein